MNLLLDTHVVLWWLAGSEINSAASTAIADPENVVLVSAASIWEISIKSASGKLTVDGDILGSVAAEFDSLEITFEHALAAGALPLHHRDPFDRMLISQAITEELTIVTRDAAFEPYDVDVLVA